LIHRRKRLRELDLLTRIPVTVDASAGLGGLGGLGVRGVRGVRISTFGVLVLL